MQHFIAADFIALSPAKAKARALAMFAEAQSDGPSADWLGVAYALHSVVSRKRGKAASQDDIAMQDYADAGLYAPWLDYEAKGKGTAILRGRVTVTFADGWSRTVGLLQAKGKGWSIGKAVQFAVACYQAAAARRLAGDDGFLYCGEHYLPGLISVPEISSIESADSDETVAGDLIWDTVAANAATLDMRAGQVDATVYGPLSRDALMAARAEIAIGLGLMPTAHQIVMRRHNALAADRVGALLFPWDRGRDPARVAFCETAFAPIMDADPEGYADPADPRSMLATPDHETMLLAGQIVGPVGPDEHAEFWGGDYAHGLSSVSFKERFLLVEDALLAWPALVEPCAYAAGAEIAVESEENTAGGAELVQIGEEEGEEQHEDTTLPPAARADEALEPTGAGYPPAAVEDVAEPAPTAKPRYRFSPITGLYEIVPAGER